MSSAALRSVIAFTSSRQLQHQPLQAFVAREPPEYLALSLGRRELHDDVALGLSGPIDALVALHVQLAAIGRREPDDAGGGDQLVDAVRDRAGVGDQHARIALLVEAAEDLG